MNDSDDDNDDEDEEEAELTAGLRLSEPLKATASKQAIKAGSSKKPIQRDIEDLSDEPVLMKPRIKTASQKAAALAAKAASGGTNGASSDDEPVVVKPKSKKALQQSAMLSGKAVAGGAEVAGGASSDDEPVVIVNPKLKPAVTRGGKATAGGAGGVSSSGLAQSPKKEAKSDTIDVAAYEKLLGTPIKTVLFQNIVIIKLIFISLFTGEAITHGLLVKGEN